jgi:hypothetical protein
MERVLGHSGDGLQEGARHLHADDGGCLEQAFLRRRQSVQAGGEDAVHGGGNVELNARLQRLPVGLQREQFLVL